MNVALAYCYPLVDTRKHFQLAMRFANTYRKFNPGVGHMLYVITNGGEPSGADLRPFNGLPYINIKHDNHGWDIGAYQKAASEIPCDLLVCLGSYCHFHRENWLRYMVEAYVDYGPNLYGCWGCLLPRPHIRTTVFWLPPQILDAYPDEVGNTKSDRYSFEHGENSILNFTRQCGFDALMVTVNGVYHQNQWHQIPCGISESILLEQMTHEPSSRMDR